MGKRESVPARSDCGSAEGKGSVGMHCKKIHAPGTVGQGRFLQRNPDQDFHQWPCCSRGCSVVQIPDGYLWITAPESAREETQGEIVSKLDSEVYESEMDDEEEEGMEDTLEKEDEEGTMEDTMEETVEMVQEEMRNINKEDKLYI